MIRQSIKRQIVSIAVGLIILMIITSALSMVMAGKVGHLLDELTMRYIPAYGHLARTDIRTDERDLALRSLERAYEERSTVLAYLLIDPRLAPLRSDARFLALAQRLRGE